VLPESSQWPSDQNRSRLRNLLKRYPECVPAEEILSQLVNKAALNEVPEIVGDVVAISYATRRSRPMRIIALPCGEAGHILKLIRLRKQVHAWEHQNGPSISPDSLETSDEGFWMSTGGAIRQIAVCDDAFESSALLAVRQDTLITILHPKFGKVLPLAARNTTTRTFPPSRLSPNPVASLKPAIYGSGNYADVSFNPWYTRQFITVDTLGHWSTWSMEGRPQAGTLLPLVAGKSGNIKDGHETSMSSGASILESSDGWHRALWMCNISTIVVIGSRDIVPFDISSAGRKARPTRLRCISLRSEQILDAKRSPSNQSHLFLLTTSRVLWVQVAPSGDNEREDPGAKILLSQRHFRDLSNASLRLSVLNRAPGT
jgi:RNA polymerase I-specific transcription initiation factor RRN6